MLALAVVILAPLPFGSVAPMWIALWCVPMAISLATAQIGVADRSLTVVLAAVLGIVALLLGLAALQLSPILPPDHIWQEASELLGEELGARSSATRLQPFATLGLPLLMAMTFCRFALLAQGAARAHLALKVIAWMGLGYALIAAFNFIVAPDMLLLQRKTAYLNNLTGPFVNRNTAATFFGSISIIWFTLFLGDMQRSHPGGAKLHDWLWLLTERKDRRMLVRGAGFALCFAATAATGSRAGFLLTIAALTLAAALQLGTGRLTWRNVIRFCVAAITLLILLEFVGGTVASRLHLIGLDDEGRFDVYLAQARLLSQAPVFGIGLGNFEAAFPSVRPSSISILGIWDKGHSTPLELTVELGLPLAILVFTLWLWILWRIARAALLWRDTVTTSALCVGLLGTTHSMVDFSLQIPGYSILFAAITAVGLARAIRLPCRPSGKPAPTGML